MKRLKTRVNGSKCCPVGLKPGEPRRVDQGLEGPRMETGTWWAAEHQAKVPSATQPGRQALWALPSGVEATPADANHLPAR